MKSTMCTHQLASREIMRLRADDLEIINGNSDIKCIDWERYISTSSKYIAPRKDELEGVAMET